MSASYYVVKAPVNGVDGQSQVAGFNRTRYSSAQHCFGTLPAQAKGSFFYFGQLPGQKIISAFFKTIESTPVTLHIGPSVADTALTNSTPLSITANSVSTVQVDYDIVFDSLYSGKVGGILILQVN